ncbi:MAG: WD40 repeat domain-containing protein [Gemmataceae bacterium]
MTIEIFDLVKEREVCQLPGYHGKVYSIAFSPDNQTLAAGGEDGNVRLWNIDNSRLKTVLTGHEGGVLAVAFSPDGELLATGSEDRTWRLWGVQQGADLGTLWGHEDEVVSLAFSPDGTLLASGSEDQTIRLWDTVTGQETCSLRGHQGRVESLAFSPDGRTLASGSWDWSVRLWDVASGKLNRLLTGHTGAVHQLAFAPDGQTLASCGGDRTIRLWNLSSVHRSLPCIEQHNGVVFSLAFAPDGRTLVSGSEDRTSRRWDTTTGQELRLLYESPGLISLIAFSPTATLQVSVTSGGSSLFIRKTMNKLGETGRVRSTPTTYLDKLWTDLAEVDDTRAASVIRTLTTAPSALPFLQTHLQPAAAVSVDQCANWLRDLRAGRLRERRQAYVSFLRWGDQTQTWLTEQLAVEANPATRTLLQTILDQLQRRSVSRDERRTIRAVQALLRMGTVEARQLLDKLAQGASEAALTRAAQTALEQWSAAAGTSN